MGYVLESLPPHPRVRLPQDGRERQEILGYDLWPYELRVGSVP